MTWYEFFLLLHISMAVIWVGETGEERIFTYGELLRQVNRCANALTSLGINKGDRVTIYLPR